MFCVRHLQENGLPQGSLLSVSLFAVAINGLVNAVWPTVVTSFYVHDVAICCCSQSIVTIESRHESAISRLSRSVHGNGFSFSSDKTRCLHFTRLRALHPDTCLSLKNRDLSFLPIFKFLDLFLESKLSWEPHMKYLSVKCERSLNI